MLLAEIDPGNTKSESVVAKLGFKRNETFVRGDELVDCRDGSKIPKDQRLWYLPRHGVAGK